MKSILDVSEVKEELKGLKVSLKYLERLDAKIRAMIRESMVRTTSNGRRTVLPRDL